MNHYLNLYMKYLREDKGRSSNTIASYRRDLSQFFDYMQSCGIHALADTTRTHVQGYMLHLKKIGRASSTINRTLVAIRSFYHFLIMEQVMERDPTLNLDAPKPEKRPPVVLTLEETRRLLDAPDIHQPGGLRDKAMLELLYATGIRVTELISLDVDSLNTEVGYIQCLGKGNRERIIPVNRIALEWQISYLREARPQLLKEDPNERSLFVNQFGTRLTRQGIWKLLKKYGKDAGIDETLTPHTLRHSFAAHLLQNGADLKSVQQLMGHADLSATDTYSSLMDTRMNEVYARTHPRNRQLVMERG